MRRLALLLLLAGHQPAFAEEPLFLRIRPNPMADGIGAGGAASPDEVARRAWLAREAVWERSRRNAELAIASVCTGCLSPLRPPPTIADADPRPRPAQTVQLGP